MSWVSWKPGRKKHRVWVSWSLSPSLFLHLPVLTFWLLCCSSSCSPETGVTGVWATRAVWTFHSKIYKNGKITCDVPSFQMLTPFRKFSAFVCLPVPSGGWFFFFNFFIFSFFGVLSKSIGSLIFRSSLSHTNSRTSIYYTFRSIYYTYISLII